MQRQISSIVSILETSKDDKNIHITGFKQLLDIDISTLKDKDIKSIHIIECIANAMDTFTNDSIIYQLCGGVLIKFSMFDSCASKASSLNILAKLVAIFPGLEQESAAISVLGAIAYLSLSQYDRPKAGSKSILSTLQFIMTKWNKSEKVLQQYLVLLMSYLSIEQTHNEFIKTNLYDLTYQSITYYMKNPKLYFGYVKCNFALSSSNNGRLFIMKNNIIPVLSNIVSLFPGNKDISLEICKILFKLNLDESTREQAICKGCIKVIGQILMSCLQDKDIITIGLQTMRSVASVGKLPVDYMIADNSIAILVMCMLAYPNENNLILHGLRTIQLLVLNGNESTVIKLCIDEGIYKVFGEILSNNTNAEAIRATYQLLAELSNAKVHQELIEDNITSNKIYQISSNLLSKFLQNDVILVSVCKFFSCLCNSADGRQTLIQQNVVVHLLGILSSHPHTDVAFASATNLLWKLTIEREARDIVIKNNGIVLLLKLLQKYPTFQPVQISCIGTLNLLAENNASVCTSIRKYLGHQLIISSIEQFIDDPNIDLQATSLLTSMAALDKSCKDLLLNKSIIPIFIKILTKFPTHAKLAYTVVSALLVLSYEPAGMVQLQKDPEYIAVLENVFQKLPKASVDLPVQSLIKRIKSKKNFN